jgi:hypothetical protein
MDAQPAALAASGRPPDPQRPASPGPAPGRPPSMLWRVAPVAGLFLLAPLVGEYLLGNVSIVELPALPILALLYGSGAILVRELARRTGRGWPTMLGLGLAYGLLEAGPIDQTLFNPPGAADAGATYLPAVGLAFVAGHAVWSIGVPIAIVEALARGRRTTPWLGPIGLSVTGGLYLLGAVLVFRNMERTEQFLAPLPWRLGAAVVAAGLVGLAFALPRKPRPPVERPAPGPRLVGLVAFVAATLFFLKSESWAGTAFGVLVAGATAALVTRWSRRAGWGHRHRLALAGGALLTVTARRLRRSSSRAGRRRRPPPAEPGSPSG